MYWEKLRSSEPSLQPDSQFEMPTHYMNYYLDLHSGNKDYELGLPNTLVSQGKKSPRTRTFSTNPDTGQQCTVYCQGQVGQLARVEHHSLASVLQLSLPPLKGYTLKTSQFFYYWIINL